MTFCITEDGVRDAEAIDNGQRRDDNDDGGDDDAPVADDVRARQLNVANHDM